MQTKFNLGDKIFLANQYKQEGYDEVGEVKKIKILRYDEDTEEKVYSRYYNAKYGEVVEIIVYDDKGNLRSLIAADAFNNKEDAIRAAIKSKESKIETIKIRMAEEEKELNQLKSQL